MNGTILPETIKELSYDKEVTLFLDGDRGGKLIAKNVINNARVDYITFAPDGKEVEELSDKEILSSLRKRIPIQEFSFFDKKKKFRKKEAFDKREGRVEINISKLANQLKEVENTKSALLLDRKLNIIDRVPIRGIFSILKKKRNVSVIVVDKATPTVIKAAEDCNVRNIAARNFTASSEKVNLISL